MFNYHASSSIVIVIIFIIIIIIIISQGSYDVFRLQKLDNTIIIILPNMRSNGYYD